MNFATGYAEKKKFDFGKDGAWVEIQRPNMEQSLEVQAIQSDDELTIEQKHEKTLEKYAELIKSWNLEQNGKAIKCNKKNKMLLLGTRPFFNFVLSKVGNLEEWETKEALEFDLVSKN